MPTKARKSRKSETKTIELSFMCKFCGKPKPLKDMMTITRFFPPLMACRDCQQKLG